MMNGRQTSELTTFDSDARLETPLVRLSLQEALVQSGLPERQAKMREIFELPGIIVVDGVMPEHVLAGLREGLSSARRKFKDKFNQGTLTTETFLSAYREAVKRMTDVTAALFGYKLPTAGPSASYRPMISENEPLHFDTYPVQCGQAALMSVLNFDIAPRLWHVGYSFREICASHSGDVQKILQGMLPSTSPSVPLRIAGEKGIGPLHGDSPVHKIAFAPNAVWFANPKAISHRIMYGNGALFSTCYVDVQNCGCQRCLLKKAGIEVPEIV